MDQIALTEQEEQLTQYCEDFCPIYGAITDYNTSYTHKIFCPKEMCASITKAYILNKRETNLPQSRIEQILSKPNNKK